MYCLVHSLCHILDIETIVWHCQTYHTLQEFNSFNCFILFSSPVTCQNLWTALITLCNGMLLVKNCQCEWHNQGSQKCFRTCARQTQCLEKKMFAGTHRFLTCLFTFWIRWPIVSWLRANGTGRNWFRTIIKTIKKKKKSQCSVLFLVTLYCAVKGGQSCMQMKSGTGKLVIQTETDVGSELLWPHLMLPTMARQLSQLMCSNNGLHTPTSERQSLSKRKTAWTLSSVSLVKVFN